MIVLDTNVVSELILFRDFLGYRQAALRLTASRQHGRATFRELSLSSRASCLVRLIDPTLLKKSFCFYLGHSRCLATALK